MQTTTTPPVATPISRTDRPAPTPLSQLVAKVLNVPVPPPAQTAPQASQAPTEPPARADGRDMRLGMFVDIRV